MIPPMNYSDAVKKLGEIRDIPSDTSGNSERPAISLQ